AVGVRREGSRAARRRAPAVGGGLLRRRALPIAENLPRSTSAFLAWMCGSWVTLRDVAAVTTVAAGVAVRGRPARGAVRMSQLDGDLAIVRGRRGVQVQSLRRQLDLRFRGDTGG